MKHPRIPGLLVLVVVILTVLGGTASATGLTSPENTVYTSTISAASEGHVVFDNPIAKIECSSAIEGKVESHGESVTAKGNVSSLSFTSCTNSWSVTVTSAGSLEVHATENDNGTVTSTGAKIEATRLGITCRYATNNTSIGTLTGSYTTESTATLDLNGSIPFESGSAFCGTSPVSWTGSYTVNSPEFLTVEANAAVTVRLCEEAVEPCPDEKTFPAGTEFLADPVGSATAAFDFTFKGAAKHVTCTGTQLAGKTSVKEGIGSIGGTISTIAFPNCTPAKVCEVTLPSKPTVMRIRRGGKGYEGLMLLGNDYKFKINCPGEGFYCVYTANEMIGTLIPGSPPKDIVSNKLINVAVDSSSKDCGTWLTFVHEWRFEKPQVNFTPKVYVSRS